ncbi:flavin reductase family protein [Nonomuraea sp. CA-141351]|uniref:flavin reductase family protein n=1 Tax=Nonomuraea sp. CA-141351 TaxID=3239996 RepID=UPI003D8D7F75
MIETIIDPLALRTVLGRFATGIVVITAGGPGGRPIGMTVNSFSSVSMNPPLILYCINRSSQLHPTLISAERFAVNVLTESQRNVSRQFARPGFDRFGAMSASSGSRGIPVLRESLAVIECVTDRVVRAGDHDIVLGQVLSAETTAHAVPEPLIYFGGAYRSLAKNSADWWAALA